MLIIATMSGREKNKNNGMKKQKAYMPTRKKILLVSNTLKKLHKDTKDVMCKIAQVDQFLVCC